jgi:hypothetical protein
MMVEMVRTTGCKRAQQYREEKEMVLEANPKAKVYH